MSTLAAVDVSYRVGPKVLVDRVDLVVRPGELVAVVGPNGAGKSTLLGLLAADLRPASGVVTLDEIPVATYRSVELARRRSVLPQASLLQFAFTVAEVVHLGRHAAAAPDDDERVVAESLDAVDMTGYADRSYLTLSGGERARVDLARVLAQETPVLLLDEPTAALDLRHQHSILSVVRDLASRGRAVLAVLHDLNLAAGYADRMAVLDGGRLVREGAPEAVLTRELVHEVFGRPVDITTHPRTGRPVILP